MWERASMVLLLTALFAYSAAIEMAQSDPIETSLCKVVQHPQAYENKVIKIRAAVLTDWKHTTVLVHSGCTRWIELFSTDAMVPEQVKELDEAVGNPMEGGYDRTAMATLTGRFFLRRGKAMSAFDNQLKFDAYRAEDIRIYSRR